MNGANEHEYHHWFVDSLPICQCERCGQWHDLSDKCGTSYPWRDGIDAVAS